MHTVRQSMTKPSLCTTVQLPRVPGTTAPGARYARSPELELNPARPPWASQGQGPGGRFPLGTFQRAAGYVLQNVPAEDPLREVKAHARAIAAEGLVQVHGAAGRRGLERLGFTHRQVNQLLRAARRPQPMRGATPALTVIDEVPNGAR